MNFISSEYSRIYPLSTIKYDGVYLSIYLAFTIQVYIQQLTKLAFIMAVCSKAIKVYTRGNAVEYAIQIIIKITINSYYNALCLMSSYIIT